MNRLFEVINISSGYGRKVVLKNINFHVDSGDFIGVIGPNGSGKSTLLKTVTRCLKPFKGKVLLNGENIHRISLKEVAKKIALVPQDTLIRFSFSVLEIVLMGRFPHLGRFQYEGKEDFEIAKSCLELTDSLKLINCEINELSAGERQCVIIAKALVQEPILLMLDEPTSHLDIGHQIQILDLLRRLNKEKKLTIISVLHDLNLASEYCNQLILINDGKIHTMGSPDEVLNYKIIEEVYNTLVLMDKNPVSSKPHIFLLPKNSVYE